MSLRFLPTPPPRDDFTTLKRAELQGADDAELAKQALACRRLLRRAADDGQLFQWWVLIEEEAVRRRRPEIAESAHWQEANEHRAAREANRKALEDIRKGGKV